MQQLSDILEQHGYLFDAFEMDLTTNINEGGRHGDQYLHVLFGACSAKRHGREWDQACVYC
jgi:hypothetical protein